MGFLEYRGIFHADGSQSIDVEESTVVQFLICHAPVGKSVELGIEQLC